MKYLVFCVTLNLLFFANIVSSAVNILANFDDATTNTKKYDIKQALQLLCNVTPTEEDLDPNAKLEVKWEKDLVPVNDLEKLKHRLSLSHNGNNHKLQISSTDENDAGNYTCVAYINNIEQKRVTITVENNNYDVIAITETWLTPEVGVDAVRIDGYYLLRQDRGSRGGGVGNILVKIPRDITVIEGEKLRVVCLVHGNPTPYILWIYKNTTYDDSAGRITLEEDPEKKIPNAVFIIDEATLEDQGELTCKGFSKTTNDSSDPSSGQIRVIAH